VISRCESRLRPTSLVAADSRRRRLFVRGSRIVSARVRCVGSSCFSSVPARRRSLVSSCWNRLPGEYGDVSRHTNGDLAAALGLIKAKTLVVQIDACISDLLNEPP
jgi:hypothetical protein